jgi:predicted GNAT family acetyltransferase
MELERFADVSGFVRAAGAFLEAREAEHSLLFGTASILAAAPARYPGPNVLVIVRHEGTVVLAAVETPPFGLVLSEIDRVEALDLLLDDLATVDLPSVLGPAELIGAFARRLADRRGVAAVLESSQRIFRTTSVRRPAPAPGRLRQAGPADRDLLLEWFAAFEQEALGEDDPSGVADVVDERLERGWIHLWDDDGPVSFVAIGGLTPNGVLLEGGYTPAGLRGRGYGSNTVAEISRSLLEEGARLVFLFTDLANPVSNHVYPALGYAPVRDVEVWRFEPR